MSRIRALLGISALLLVAWLSVPLLREGRAQAPEEAAAAPAATSSEADPSSGEHWRYCALDGFLSDCCGGSPSSCPPGTEMSAVSWLGSCRNPADGKDYVISYNDCCGKPACGRCFTKRDEGEKPVYYTHKNNDIDWCMGTQSIVYNSTVAVVVGVAGSPGSP